MQITKNIYQIDNIKGANLYLVKVKNGLILIDSGMPGSGQTIADFIKQTWKNQPLLYLILTHCDIDHIGSALKIKELTGAKIAIHGDDALVLEGKKSGKKIKGALGLVFKILSYFMKVEHTRPDKLLKDGDNIEGLKIIHVPGHTLGSICAYLKEDGIVFSGDALLGDKEGRLKDPIKSLCLDYDLALKSAEKIKSLKFKLLLPGHGKPVRNSSNQLKN